MRYLIIVALVLISACETPAQKEPQGYNYMYSKDITAKFNQGIITEDQKDEIYSKDKATCTNEALRISIPAPFCTQPPKQDCTGLTGFAAGFCRTNIPPKDCDYSATNIAKDSQEKVYLNCMILRGWKRYWVPNGENPIAYIESMNGTNTKENISSSEESNLQKVIESIPELSGWQKNDQTKWNLAISIDDQLREMPEYKDLPIRERFLVVVKKVQEVSK